MDVLHESSRGKTKKRGTQENRGFSMDYTITSLLETKMVRGGGAMN
jgi:hypothetical protein